MSLFFFKLGRISRKVLVLYGQQLSNFKNFPSQDTLLYIHTRLRNIPSNSINNTVNPAGRDEIQFKVSFPTQKHKTPWKCWNIFVSHNNDHPPHRPHAHTRKESSTGVTLFFLLRQYTAELDVSLQWIPRFLFFSKTRRRISDVDICLLVECGMRREIRSNRGDLALEYSEMQFCHLHVHPHLLFFLKDQAPGDQRGRRLVLPLGLNEANLSCHKTRQLAYTSGLTTHHDSRICITSSGKKKNRIESRLQ